MPISDSKSKYPHLFKIDESIEKLLKGIELLAYLNPHNIEQEKKKFFSSKYHYEPVFVYPKLKFNPFEVQRKLFAHKLHYIEEEVVRNFYEDVIYYYSCLVDAVKDIGTGPKFYYNSLKLFGAPKETDVDNARFILHFEDEQPSEASLKRHTSTEAQRFFEEFSKNYEFTFGIEKSTNIAADAMVRNRSKILMLKKNAKFSDQQLNILAHHEIGVHMLTSYNAEAQPLHIFSNGFPRNVETQEGLAVFSEYMAGALTIKRIKTLAYRVLAVDSLRKGYSFSDTFDLLFHEYSLNRDDAFTITMRVHRGGGFTKDYLYLTGLKKIYDYHQKGENLKVLLTGKVSLQHKEAIETLQKLGLASDAKYFNKAFLSNHNTNETLTFILASLK